MSRRKAVVTGMMTTYSVGGVAWDYGQYALGMERLGFEVYYLEDTALPAYTFNTDTGEFEVDCSYGLRFLEQSLEPLCPALKERWHFRSVDDQIYGMEADQIADVLAEADVLLNVSGGTLLRDEYRHCRRKVFIDTDPGWNHFVIFHRWDSKPEAVQSQGYRGHDYFFTFAERMGRSDCPLASFGLTWHPTRHPVISDFWSPQPPGDRWTTVMMWNNYERPVEHEGRSYGAKEQEFDRIEELPTHCSSRFEVAVTGEAPRDRWRTLGWSVANGGEKSKTAEEYRNYIQGSRGEFSVAKGMYVGTRSGWFSGRSACYLASGRPVVLQETGFSDCIPTGDGLLSYTTLEGAARAVTAIECDYDHHSASARELARTHFDAPVVLGDILNRIGVS
jgi:hypothetical protein